MCFSHHKNHSTSPDQVRKVKQEIRDLKVIATVYKRRGKYTLAADVLNTVLQLEAQAYGPDSAEVALTKCELAEVLCELQQYKKARKLMMESASIWREHKPDGVGQAIEFTNALQQWQEHAANIFKADRANDSSEDQAA